MRFQLRSFLQVFSQLSEDKKRDYSVDVFLNKMKRL